MKIILLDTETTGLDGRIIELAYVVKHGVNVYTAQTLCKPPEEISFQAMAVHHITPEMLESYPPLVETRVYRDLVERFNIPENILIAHNSQFDIDMLEKEGFKCKMQVVDTERVLKHLYPDIESTSLQYVKYAFGLYKATPPFSVGNTHAHRALGDVCDLTLLVGKLLMEHSFEELLELTQRIPLIHKMPFGKYKGELMKDVVEKDRRYLVWMYRNADDISEDLKHSLVYYLEPQTQNPDLPF